MSGTDESVPYIQFWMLLGKLQFDGIMSDFPRFIPVNHWLTGCKAAGGCLLAVFWYTQIRKHTPEGGIIMNEQTLGQRIAAGRKQLGLSQEALGEKMGVSRQAISKWESDAAVPELEKLIAMSRLFGMTLGQLLGIEEAPQPAGLNEEQIRKIVQQCQTPPPRPLRGPLILCALVCGLALVFSAIALARRPAVPTDYSAQIASLQQSNQSLQRELGDLWYQLQVSQEEDAETLLLDHQIIFDGLKKNTAHITFSATLKQLNPGQDASFVVLREGYVVRDVLCTVNSALCTAAVDLPLADGYEYRFVLTDDDGSQQFQLLDDGGCAYLKTDSSIVLERWVLPDADYRRNTLYIYGLELQLTQPLLSAKAGDSSWTKLDYVITVNGQEVRRESFLEPDYRDSLDWGLSEGTRSFKDITLNSGDQVSLTVDAAVSSGLSEALTVGTWTFQNGKLVSRN